MKVHDKLCSKEVVEIVCNYICSHLSLWKDVPSHVIIVSLLLFVFVSPRSNQSQVKSKVIPLEEEEAATGADIRLFYGSKKANASVRLVKPGDLQT